MNYDEAVCTINKYKEILRSDDSINREQLMEDLNSIESVLNELEFARRGYRNGTVILNDTLQEVRARANTAGLWLAL